MGAPDSIYQLVEKFDRDKPGSEDEVQQQFVDPLFEALGWDLRDKRQVRHEPSVTVMEEGLERSKRADYSFHIGNTRHFFVETKMPHVNLERNSTPAFQLRRYGWSGGTPVSVLTDFEEFCAYNCRIQPSQNDPADRARLRYWRYETYIDNWDEIESRFHREAVAQGALREWVEGERVRGVISVDQSFLRAMEDWRELLAKDIALHNRDLSQRQLNLLVQRTIDRIVFLRIAEDRDIEAYRRLRSAAEEGKQVYEELKRLFIEADDKYNSGLFHFGADERASDPDRDSLKVHIPDEPLRHIIKNLYFPFSPYEFSVLPADILGQVYERFLGKVIELSAGGAVRVEEKPEVRKAGGVYYTPTYIVDYIVENTVGDLLWGKTPEDAAKLRILDPACGSGSFLTGAYHYLLDWHLKYYRDHPNQYRNRRRETADGMILTTAEKRRILRNNIYGVDLDENAVEVSKLSLLLKMLENENDATGRQTLMFSAGGRILPDLSGNIKWGNSLIGSDFFRGAQMGLFDDEELLRVKPFDWASEAGFGTIMHSGGFDAVIGNPPYIFITGVPQSHRQYYRRRYKTCEYRFDIYGLFIELPITSLLRDSGMISYIIPHTLLSNDSFEKLRRLVLGSTHIQKVIDIGPDVFKGAKNETMIFVFKKTQNGRNYETIVSNTSVKRFPTPMSQFSIHQDLWSKNHKASWLVNLPPSHTNLLLKLQSNSIQLADVCTINQGLRTGNNSKYLSDVQADSKWKKAAGGKQIARYQPISETQYVYYEPSVLDAPRKEYLFTSKEKIVIQEVRNITLRRRLVATYDSDQFYCLQSTNVINVKPKVTTNIKFLLGIINSNLINYFFRSSFPGNNHIPSNKLALIPVPSVNSVQHDRLVALVDAMLDLHRQLPGLTAVQRSVVEQRIEAVDREIDGLVYQLYGLSGDEVRVVEGG